MSDMSSKLPADLNREAVRSALTEWYEADYRDFPWWRTDDPYEILVSKVMGQQTQLDHVVKTWGAFPDEWSTAADLAAAGHADVVGSWTDHQPGYNNRTKYLREATRQIEEDHGGEFPRTPDGLSELMGVGPYITNAVTSFAFDNGDAVVDTNVKRVLHRAFVVPDNGAALETAASELMPDNEPRVWDNAIMELGDVACGKTPTYDEPDYSWQRFYYAYETGNFAIPDVPTQPNSEGSRQQSRGRVVRILGEYDELGLSGLGPQVRVDYDGDTEAEWLHGLVDDLESNSPVDVAEGDDDIHVSLAK